LEFTRKGTLIWSLPVRVLPCFIELILKKFPLSLYGRRGNIRFKEQGTRSKEQGKDGVRLFTIDYTSWTMDILLTTHLVGADALIGPVFGPFGERALRKI